MSGSSGPHPAECLIFSRMEIPPPLWCLLQSCTRLSQESFLLTTNLSCNLCPGAFCPVTGHLWEGSSSVVFVMFFRQWGTVRKISLKLSSFYEANFPLYKLWRCNSLWMVCHSRLPEEGVSCSSLLSITIWPWFLGRGMFPLAAEILALVSFLPLLCPSISVSLLCEFLSQARPLDLR